MLTDNLNSRLRAYCSPTAKPDHAPDAPRLVYSPVQLVLRTPELLELILLGTDMRTLLLSQRVNRMFQQTITSSPRLRQTLWFEPSPQIPASTSPIVNPLIAAQVSKASHSHFRFLELEYSHLDFYPSLSRRLRPAEPPTVCIAIAPKARAAPWSGSWRRMLVVQPYDVSTRWDVYHYRWTTRDWDWRFSGMFEDEGVGGPRAGRITRFALGPGFEGKPDE